MDSTVSEELANYFKHLQQAKSLSAAKETMVSLQNQQEKPFDISGVDLSLLHPAFANFVQDSKSTHYPRKWYFVKSLFDAISNNTFYAPKILDVLKYLLENSRITSPFPSYKFGVRILGACCATIHERIQIPVLLLKRAVTHSSLG